MNILAINTTNKLAKVVCKSNDKIKQCKMDSSYSEHILPAIMDVLEQSDVELSQIDCLGIVTGPGSFTGIRIGMSVVKGIMCAQNTKCVQVNSFELVSYNIKDQNFIVLLDSGNQEPYYAIFKNRVCEEYGFSSIDKIKNYAQTRELKIYYSSAEKTAFDKFDFLQSVEVAENSLIELISQKAKQDDFVCINNLSPVYIKQSQAEIGLEKDIRENMSYRTANSNDANALALVDEQCFPDGSEKYSEQTFVEELAQNDRHYIVATYKNLVVGYVGLWHTGDDLNLLKIAVLPQFRKLGVGFNLMQQSANYRSQNNLDKYFLEVRKDNEEAIKLYKKFGFSTLNTRSKYYDDGTDCLVMFSK